MNGGIQAAIRNTSAVVLEAKVAEIRWENNNGGHLELIIS